MELSPVNISPLPADMVLSVVSREYYRDTGGRRGRIQCASLTRLLKQGLLSSWAPTLFYVPCWQWHMAHPCGQLHIAHVGQHNDALSQQNDASMALLSAQLTLAPQIAYA